MIPTQFKSIRKRRRSKRSKRELEKAGRVFVEQVIRPTGLIDPPVEVRPVAKDGFSQVDDVIAECREFARRGYRALVTVLITGSKERAMTETSRRREKQTAYNLAHGITPESIRSQIKDILASPYDRGDRVTVDVGVAENAKPFLGSNFQATLKGTWKGACAKPPGNLKFEEAARLRDEIKRLKAATISCLDIPSAIIPTTAVTGMRSPRMQGTPPICLGSMVICVNNVFHVL